MHARTAAVEVALVPFDEVYLVHSDNVYRFCVSMLHDLADAEDVTATTFLSAYAAYSRVRPLGGELKPWLFRIARNASIDQLRRRGRARRLLGVLRVGTSSKDDIENLVITRSELRDVVETLARLSRRDRELVGLRIAGELTHAEIGRVLGLSEQAAKTATRRALARLSDHMARKA